MRTILWAALLLLAVASAGKPARAQESEIAFRAGVSATYSDNAARTPTNPISATAVDGLLGLTWAHNSPVLYADADVSELQRWYAQGKLPDETIPNGTLKLIIRPVQDVFSWTVQDTLGQISSEPFAALVATDRQTVNVLSTGPDLRIPLDSRDHFDLAGRYGLDHFGNSSLDDHSFSGRADFAHDIGATSEVALYYGYERIDYRQNTFSAAEIQRAYAKYSLEGARTYVVLEAGADQLAQGASPRVRTAHVLVLLQRHLTDRLTFEVGYVDGYNDTGQAFVASSRDRFTAGTDQTVQAIALPFEESRGYAMLTRSVGRLQAAVEITASQESYPGQPAADRHTIGSNLATDYRLSSTLTFSLRAGYWEDRFPRVQEYNRWLGGSLGLSQNLGRSLQLSLLLSRYHNTTTVLSGPVTENRATLALTYTPGGARLQRVYDANAPFRFYDRPTPQPR